MNWATKLTIFQVLFIGSVFLFFYQGHLFKYFINYAKHLVNSVANDNERRQTNLHLMAQIEWNYHQLQTQYMEQICQTKKLAAGKKYTWLTALVNDDYVPPAIVLGHSIRTLSCVRNMLVLVSNDVSHSALDTLAKVGWNVQVVNAMDCRWMDRQLGRIPSSKGIHGTYTRFHAWNYTQYSKIIYADPDYMLLSNIDELFEVSADFSATYCSRPGLIDPCFNAGLLVFRPDSNDYQSIMHTWRKISEEESCPSDQELLFYYFANTGRWNPLPYAYNVRRIIFRPMKAFHFACCPPPKPWKEKCRPSRVEARSFDQPITNLREVSLVYWKKFYEALERYEIDPWWQGTKYYHSEMEYGKFLYRVCWNDK